MADLTACYRVSLSARISWLCVCTHFLRLSHLSQLSSRFYFPGFLVGPYLTYNEYQALVTGSLYKDAEKHELNVVNEADHLSQRLVPHGRKRVAYRKMFTGLLYLALFVLFYPECNFQLTVTDEFEARTLISR